MSQPQPQPPPLPDDLGGMDLFQFVTSTALQIQDPELQNQLDFRDLAARGIATWVRAEVSARQMLQGEPEIILVSNATHHAAHILTRGTDKCIRRPWLERPAPFALCALHECISSRRGGFKTDVFPIA